MFQQVCTIEFFHIDFHIIQIFSILSKFFHIIQIISILSKFPYLLYKFSLHNRLLLKVLAILESEAATNS